jgi:hypothetical protein
MIDKGNLSEKKGTVNSRKEAYMKQTWIRSAQHNVKKKNKSTTVRNRNSRLPKSGVHLPSRGTCDTFYTPSNVG